MGISPPRCLRLPPGTDDSGSADGSNTADTDSARGYGDTRHLRCRPTTESGAAVRD
jgi:hypothetical protein